MKEEREEREIGKQTAKRRSVDASNKQNGTFYRLRFNLEKKIIYECRKFTYRYGLLCSPFEYKRGDKKSE